MLLLLSMTCLTVVGQRKENVRDAIGRKAIFTETLLKTASAKTRLPAETRAQKHRNMAGMQLRAAGETAISAVSYSAEGEKEEKQVDTYNAKGLVTQSVYASWDGNNWNEYDKEVLEYNNAGLRTLRTWYDSDDGGNTWTPSTKEVSDYDANGNEILYEYYSTVDNVWVGREKSTYTYTNGIVTAVAEYSWKNNGWVLSEEGVADYGEQTISEDKIYVAIATTTYYDSEDGPATVEEVVIHFPYFGYYPLLSDESEGDVVCESTFDNTGNLTKADIYLVTEVKTLVNSCVIAYENNLPVSFKAYDKDNELRMSSVEAYDARGRATLYELHQWNDRNNRLETEHKEVYAFDANGRQTLYEHYYGDESGNGWARGYRTETTYDNWGNEVLKMSYRWDDSASGWELSSKETYAYNVAGKITLYENRYYYSFSGDGSDGGGDKALYEYGADGNVFLRTYYRWYDNEWGISNHTLYYPDATQTAPIALNSVGVEVPGNNARNYDLDLESLLPDLTGFGALTYTIGTVADNDNVIGDLNYTGGTTLTLPINNVGGGWASIPVTITSANYGSFLSAYVIVVTGGSVETEQVVSQEAAVFFNGSTLTVDSPANETVAIYDFSGQLLFAGKKPQGKAVFTLANPAGGKAVIVKGGSGWTKKLVW
jgi:hypothetical protein